MCSIRRRAVAVADLFDATEGIRVLDEKCAEVGRDPDDVVRSLYLWAAKAAGDPWDSIDAFNDIVGRYREVGINEFIIDQPRPGQMAVLERAAVEAIPALRA